MPNEIFLGKVRLWVLSELEAGVYSSHTVSVSSSFSVYGSHEQF